MFGRHSEDIWQTIRWYNDDARVPDDAGADNATLTTGLFCSSAYVHTSRKRKKAAAGFETADLLHHSIAT